MGNAYLVTADPRVGKTTLIKRIVASIGDNRCGGFYTEEIYDPKADDPRMGFRLVTLSGKSGVLAHVQSESTLRLGRYGINLSCLESVGIPALLEAQQARKIIILDEIGPLQALSNTFQHTFSWLLQGTQPILGTVVK